MSEDREKTPELNAPSDPPPVAEEPRGGLRVLHLMYAIVGCALLAWVVRLNDSGFWMILLLGAVVFATAVGLAVVLARRNATQQESLLWALAIAADRSMPLPPAALAFADQYSATFRWRVRLFASYLTEGLSFPQALDRVPRLLSREAQALVKTGWSTGTLARSLREAAQIRSERQSAWAAVAFRFMYLGGVFLALQSLSMFILYFITPNFEAIFKDFGLQLPGATIFTIKLSHTFIDYGFVTIILAFLELVIFAALPLGLFNVFQWDIPILDRLYRRRHTPLILRTLALSVEGDKPILAGIEGLTVNYPSRWVRGRLSLVSEDVRGGERWVESLRRRQLIGQADAAVIASSERLGNLLWALRETAQSCERRIGYRLQFWLQTLFPLTVLMMGAFVLIFCVAYFSPVIRLIERLS